MRRLEHPGAAVGPAALAPRLAGRRRRAGRSSGIGCTPTRRRRRARPASRRPGSTRTTEFEERLRALVDAVYDDAELHASIGEMADRLAGPGRSNSLSAKLVQLTMPGVPDVYQGSELWDHSPGRSGQSPARRLRAARRSVAPDRRRVASGMGRRRRPPAVMPAPCKLLVTASALRLRRDRPELFTAYRAVAGRRICRRACCRVRPRRRDHRRHPAAGRARHRRGVARHDAEPAPRPSGPTYWPTEVCVGGATRLADLLAAYPVALLVRTGEKP